jgi:hypothetical protein
MLDWPTLPHSLDELSLSSMAKNEPSSSPLLESLAI